MSCAESVSPVYCHAETVKGETTCKIYAGMSYRFTWTSALLLGNRLVMDGPDILILGFKSIFLGANMFSC